MERETAKAAAAFAEYCALGDDRSLVKLAEQRCIEAHARGEKIGSAHSVKNQLGVWSSKYGWQERVKLYDRELIEKKRKQRERELEKLNEDQAKYGQAMAGLAMKQIKTLIDAKAFNAQAAVLLFKHATDLERAARGGNQELVRMEISGDPDHPAISTTEIIQNVLIYLPEKEKRDIPGASRQIIEGDIE